MEKKERSKFPKDFFNQPRPKVSTKEALKDVEPVKWSKDVLSGKKKVLVQRKLTKK